MDFVAVMDQAIALLRQRGRVTYRTLQIQFTLDDEQLTALKDELLYSQPQVRDDTGRGLIWTGAPGTALAGTAAPVEPPAQALITYTPPYLAEKILTSRSALEGERKQVTVLFADLKGSMELLADRDPEEARQLLDPVLERMMAAVHRYEGTVNQVMGDGIMALFGAPLAHEDHALRAGYAALAMQESVTRYGDELQRSQGVPMQIRVGLNSGEVVVLAIGSDLHMDYTTVGQTTHLAACMEQMAKPGSILITAETLRLAEGYIRATPLGPVPIKGLDAPVQAFELVGASGIRRRLQATAARGLTRFVGRDTEFAALVQALEQAGAGHGQVVAVVGEAGVGKSRLAYEFLQVHHTQGWRVLESASVSYGKATPYFPVLDLLRRYAHVDERDDARIIRAKVTGQLLTLDEALQDAIAPVLALLEALSDDSPFLAALTRVLLREGQVQPVLVVCEDLHWIDTETQAMLDSLVEGLPTVRLLLLVNYRPEYQHGWGGKTYYAQLRLDPLPPASTEALLQALLGDDPGLEALKPLLIARTVGNPFFLEESVRTLVETNMLVGAPGAYRLAQARPAMQVPATVQAMLSARIDRLPADEKYLLQIAAVIGTEVPMPLLQTLAELPEATLHHGLAHLQRAEFLYETRLFPEHVYTFKHTLTHEVAYGSLLQERRRGLHARIARPSNASRPTAWRTMPYGARCGTRPWPTAGRPGRRPGPGRPTARRWGVSSRRSGPWRICRSSATPTSRPSISASPCARCSARLATPRGVFWCICMRPRASRRPSTTRVGSDRACAFSRSSALPGVHMPRRSPASGRPWHPSMGSGADVLPPAVACRARLATCHGELGAFTEGRTLGDEGLRIAEAVDHPASRALASWGSGCLALRQGDLPRALPLLEQAVSICQGADLFASFPWVATALGAAYTLGGRVLALAQEHQERGHQAYALRLLGEIAARRNPPQSDQAGNHYHQTCALAEELGMRPLQAHCHRALRPHRVMFRPMLGRRKRAETRRCCSGSCSNMRRYDRSGDNHATSPNGDLLNPFI